MDVEEYISNIPDIRRARFEEILLLIKRLYTKAEESMKYKMPTYTLGSGWVAAANQKQYISLYNCSAESLEKFRSL